MLFEPELYCFDAVRGKIIDIWFFKGISCAVIINHRWFIYEWRCTSPFLNKPFMIIDIVLRGNMVWGRKPKAGRGEGSSDSILYTTASHIIAHDHGVYHDKVSSLCQFQSRDIRIVTFNLCLKVVSACKRVKRLVFLGFVDTFTFQWRLWHWFMASSHYLCGRHSYIKDRATYDTHI